MSIDNVIAMSRSRERSVAGSVAISTRYGEIATPRQGLAMTITPTIQASIGDRQGEGGTLLKESPLLL